ncbi:ABC transporter permease [Pseudonocardia sp. KRD-184]|uniref:Transport permease protein n=1 Tax=Pseudonocardia oceani TaxID=2792013 RepID=A0ABS6UIC3_9PSEU|nr:ABC transporter permease [Pseudonocardia oceani]MBW0091311.1 ABC transporter permease [Pseudonocardia oceani]MBW0097117.1 ABC transporter permease [Pseudonocardia oceani]MBW0110894.1 ABC transporter permease [Pseudonocardia oceani]MBW0123930.1 ABC transporter permease [Pseudonocardia oceani]MBW0131653.1 ABC transporter permease [Pseudonocardia oceani]
MNPTYLRLEILRVLRVPQLLVFTVVLPLVLFLVFANLFGAARFGGVSSTAYTMQGMAAYGSLGGALFSTAAIALERRIGWNRQLRLTPLPPSRYVLVKGLAAWLVTLPGLVLVYTAGALLGVALPLWRWFALAGVTWTALLPFVVLGIALGFTGSSESVQAVSTFVLLALSLLGGVWFPIEILPEWVQAVARALPSYWLNAAGRAVIGGPGIGWTGVGVLLAWTAALGLFAASRYRADARRA